MDLIHNAWPWLEANWVSVWLLPSIFFVLCVLFVMGWEDGKRKSKDELPTDWGLTAVLCVLCLGWPLALAAACVAVPALGPYHLGKWARKRHDFLPNVLKRMRGPE